MKKTIITMMIAFLVASSLAGCGGSGSKNYSGTTDLMNGIATNTELSEAEIEKGLANGGDKYYFDFAAELFKESMDGSNLLVSPLSVIYALAMTTNGADGLTRCELLEALANGRCSGEALCGTSSTGEGDIFDEWQNNLNEYLRAYMGLVKQHESQEELMLKNWGDDGKTKKPSTLNVANSIWIKDDPKLEVKEDFLKTNGEYYNAGVRKLEFDEKARKSINAWIEDNTGGTIKDMLKEISPNAIMYLINALAFEAEWMEPYLDYQVHEGEFHGENGDETVDFMTGEEYIYLEDELSTGFIKPYLGGNYAFAAILPDEGVDLDEYVSSLSGDSLKSLLEKQIYHDVIATMPKFESRSSLNLVDTFKSLGVTDAFNMEVADFTKLGSYEDQNIFIGRILHDTYIKVDEKGTKAGAATIVEMAAEGAMEEEEPPKYVVLDRPFLYMLIDTKANIPLFMGVMRNIN